MNADNAATAETWFVELVERRAYILDENRLRVADVCGDARERSVEESAYLLAGAPQLAEQLNALLSWVENNVAYGAPRALLESVGQALQDARPPL